MTRRVPCPPAPAPLEAYVQQFDDLVASLAQRRAFRDYPIGTLWTPDNEARAGLREWADQQVRTTAVPASMSPIWTTPPESTKYRYVGAGKFQQRCPGDSPSDRIALWSAQLGWCKNLNRSAGEIYMVRRNGYVRFT